MPGNGTAPDDVIDRYRGDIVRVESGVARVAVHELAGTAAHPALLVSHATGFHAHAYLAMARHLGDRFHVWGLDHRGHGATPLPESASSEHPVLDWRDCGDDTASVARSLADGRPIVGFGHSMGAATLLLAALERPHLFRRLVLFEPIAPPPPDDPRFPDPNRLAEGALRRRRRFDSYDAAYDHYVGRPPLSWFTPASLRHYVDFGFAPEPPPGTGVTLRCTPEVESATFSGAATSGLWDALPRIEVPVVVIGSGEADGPAQIARPIAERLPDARFVSLPEQTHFGPFSHPAEVAAVVAAHL